MMQAHRNQNNVHSRNLGWLQIGDSFILLLSFLFLADDEGILRLFLMAAVLHELGHYAVLRVCGGELLRLELSAGGAVMRFRCASGGGRRFVIAAAGPCMGLAVGYLAAQMGAYSFAGANISLSLFNLMPIVPLDGGTMMACALMPLGRAGERITCFISVAAAVVGCAAGAWCFTKSSGVLLLGVGIMLLTGQIPRKGKPPINSMKNTSMSRN